MDEGERTQRPHVLFGFDGTAENEPALRWAVGEARCRGLDLVMLHCWHWPYASGHVDRDAEAIMKRAGENLLEQGVHRARELGAPGAVHGRLTRGPAARALLRASTTAELVVMGAHEWLDEGATALEVPARATRPVVVVRPVDGASRPRGPVVVGVDGSARSDAVLGFAFAEAALRGWELQVVYGCWEPGAVIDSELALFNDRELLEKTRAAELEEAVGPWRDRHPTVDMTVSLLLERPCEALQDAVEHAGLLVLGDRGTGLDPLGATSTGMLRSAPCPVAIVPCGEAG
ncbi:nucleotide-binding universal stress UspA family protein [Actinomadura pelletieri DSM 43383]|uniref:Nucleotide-binding universal stress UspA family protein n=1 Tax=Actinomadura pelletieri DSM 43383 TaxID=1120940 RepID=A0A495QL15_9ACTN|nr:universal stress protein [Actinomadura pelletieri]RKS73213.1 nucleotide-binding universal stress UspA family protein [Actinomadura pelletieri DSM 43383]